MCLIFCSCRKLPAASLELPPCSFSIVSTRPALTPALIIPRSLPIILRELDHPVMPRLDFSRKYGKSPAFILFQQPDETDVGGPDGLHVGDSPPHHTNHSLSEPVLGNQRLDGHRRFIHVSSLAVRRRRTGGRYVSRLGCSWPKSVHPHYPKLRDTTQVAPGAAAPDMPLCAERTAGRPRDGMLILRILNQAAPSVHARLSRPLYRRT